MNLEAGIDVPVAFDINYHFFLSSTTQVWYGHYDACSTIQQYNLSAKNQLAQAMFLPLLFYIFGANYKVQIVIAF